MPKSRSCVRFTCSKPALIALPSRLAPRTESKNSGNRVMSSNASAGVGAGGASGSLMVVDDQVASREIDLLEELGHRGDQQLGPGLVGDFEDVLVTVPVDPD